jgi:hypothetical protein
MLVSSLTNKNNIVQHQLKTLTWRRFVPTQELESLQPLVKTMKRHGKSRQWKSSLLVQRLNYERVQERN